MKFKHLLISLLCFSLSAHAVEINNIDEVDNEDYPTLSEFVIDETAESIKQFKATVLKAIKKGLPYCCLLAKITYDGANFIWACEQMQAPAVLDILIQENDRIASQSLNDGQLGIPNQFKVENEYLRTGASKIYQLGTLRAVSSLAVIVLDLRTLRSLVQGAQTEEIVYKALQAEAVNLITALAGIGTSFFADSTLHYAYHHKLPQSITGLLTKVSAQGNGPLSLVIPFMSLSAVEAIKKRNQRL